MGNCASSTQATGRGGSAESVLAAANAERSDAPSASLLRFDAECAFAPAASPNDWPVGVAEYWADWWAAVPHVRRLFGWFAALLYVVVAPFMVFTKLLYAPPCLPRSITRWEAVITMPGASRTEQMALSRKWSRSSWVAPPASHAHVRGRFTALPGHVWVERYYVACGIYLPPMAMSWRAGVDGALQLYGPAWTPFGLDVVAQIDVPDGSEQLIVRGSAKHLCGFGPFVRFLVRFAFFKGTQDLARGARDPRAKELLMRQTTAEWAERFQT